MECFLQAGGSNPTRAVLPLQWGEWARHVSVPSASQAQRVHDEAVFETVNDILENLFPMVSFCLVFFFRLLLLVFDISSLAH